ncbi:hypothetical protein LguiA_008565 [Lonicera macranthoides]
MSEKKGFPIVATAMLVLYLMVQIDTADATTYIVGDSKGWQWDVGVWLKGKNFKAGDILVFKYEPGTHTVGIVKDKAGYDNCLLSSIVREYKSGNDQVQLVRGDQYIICGIPGHCSAGMRIAIRAT